MEESPNFRLLAKLYAARCDLYSSATILEKSGDIELACELRAIVALVRSISSLVAKRDE